MMHRYETEEQQLEALKAWWNKNGDGISWLFFAIALVYAGITGWQRYQTYTHNQASMQYQAIDLMQKDDEVDYKKINTVRDKLTQRYSDSFYANAAVLEQAKTAVEAKDYKQATQQLQWVINHADQTWLKQIAQLRLARVWVQTEKYDQAFTLFKQLNTTSLAPLATMAEADAYQKQGNIRQATQTYQKAIDLMADKEGFKDMELLAQLKMNL